MNTPTPPDDGFADFTWWDHRLHKQHTRVRRSLLGHPPSCLAAGNPRFLRASLVLTRCGHVSTGPMDVRGYDVHLAHRGITWCEGSERMHAPHAWGRVCSGPGDVAALRESWLALGRCWGVGGDHTETLEPTTRFEPARPGMDVYEVMEPAAWVETEGALAVGCGGLGPCFSARNVSLPGFTEHLSPLGLGLHSKGRVCGAVPESLPEGQRRSLLREAWDAVLEAWLFAG
ncbi:MAG: hypothetical protein RL653_714 [Pseudomonadota bacterium]|jgi:hypothetical protein